MYRLKLYWGFWPGLAALAGSLALVVAPPRAEAQVLPGYLGGDRYGFSVAWAGDVDGDGKDDFLIGAPNARVGAGDAGQVELYLGRFGHLPRTPDAVYDGEIAGDEFGYSVCAAGDVDEDGYDDFLIGAPGHDAGGLNTGRVYLLLGGGSTPAAPERTWDGDLAGARFGAALAGGFDFNRDERGDFAVGAPDRTDTEHGGGLRAGQVTIFLGAATAAQITRPFTFQGDQPNWQLGTSLDGAGDLNHDGYGDLVAGAPQRFDSNAGRAVVWFGQPSTISTPSRLVYSGERGADRFGWDVSGAGDVDGDGYDDLVVGAPAHDGNGLDDGAVYLFLGGSVVGIDADPDWTAAGGAGQDSLGYAVDGGFDFNGDGRPDLIAGAPGADGHGPGSGQVRAYFNAPSLPAEADLIVAPQAPVSSFEANDRFGASLRFVGSFNGAASPEDARAEFLAGAPNGNSTAGSVSGYVDFVFDAAAYTPVRVLSFGARAVAGGVEIRWELADADEIARLRVEVRREGEWIPLDPAWLPGETRSAFHAVAEPGVVAYRLLALDRAGKVTELSSTTIEVPPAGLALRAPGGALFGESLRIEAVIPSGTGSIVVYDARGRAVRTLLREGPSGLLSATWDGRDDRGAIAPDGVYFIRARAGGADAALKAVRVR